MDGAGGEIVWMHCAGGDGAAVDWHGGAVGIV